MTLIEQLEKELSNHAKVKDAAQAVGITPHKAIKLCQDYELTYTLKVKREVIAKDRNRSEPHEIATYLKGLGIDASERSIAAMQKRMFNKANTPKQQ